jgi:broad specificity phosphatase PhoE
LGQPGERRLVAVRHGRTAWNAEGRFQGHADPPLDDVGQATARVLAEQWAGPGIALVACSDLTRAVQTAAPLAAACALQVTVDPRLREVDVGDWEGLRPPEIEARFPAQWEAWNAGADIRRGGGETRAEASHRVAAALLDLSATIAPASTVVVVGHGMSLQGGLSHLAADGFAALDGPPPHLGNGEWVTATVDPAGGQRAAG